MSEDDIPEGYSRVDRPESYGRSVGPLYERVDPDGRITRAFRVGPQHTNGMQNCHGGMLSGFADIAFGRAIVAARPGVPWVTVRLVTDFISAARLGDWIEGSGDLVGFDGEFFTVQGRIWCGERTVISGTGTFKVLSSG